MSPTDSAKMSRQRALEWGMIKVRWFGVAFGIFQIYMGTDPPCEPSTKEVILRGACEPSFLRPLGFLLIGGLAFVNIIAVLWLRRSKTEGSLFSLGAVVFLIDHLFLIGFVFLYSFGQYTNTWALLYILPLEGALRYGMSGSLISIGIGTASEIARDFYREAVWGFEFDLVPGTTFRVGIMAIIGLVAGIMARNLQRERLEVEKRADELARLAERESALRAESQAFHRATLAGVSTGSFHDAMQGLVETIAETLEYPSLALALIEEGPREPRLRVVAGHNYPKDAIGKIVSLEEGICGPVAATGKPELINDVRQHPNYLELAPWARSEMAVPLAIADKVIGVLNVESPQEAAFTQQDLDQLARLAVGVAVVTENARVLEREQAAVKKLTELDAMKSDFIAITSHELRTPLTSIRGFVKTLRRSELGLSPEQVSEYLEVIDRQSEKLARVIEDLLFVSQIEAGRTEFLRTEIDMKVLVEELISSEFEDQSRRVLIRGEDARVVTDKGRLRRAVEALIDNALKYSPPSSPITVEITDSGTTIEVAVHDNGIGIPEEESERIFERFYQIGGSLKRYQQGFGLGLYITKQVVNSLGGDITLESAPGKGATFTIVLPRQLPIQEVAEEAS